MTTIKNAPNNKLLSIVEIGDSKIFFGDFEILTSFLYFDRKDLINKIYLKMFLRLLLYAKYKIDFKNKKHQNDQDNTAITTQYLKDLKNNISNLDSITSFELSIIYPYIKNICQEIQDESCNKDFKVIIKSFLSEDDKNPEAITNEIIKNIQDNLKSFDILSKKDEFFKNIKSILSNLKFEDNFSDEDKDNYFSKLHKTINETIQNLKEYIKTKKELESYIKEKLDSQQINNEDQDLFHQLADIISSDKYIILEGEGQQTGEREGQQTGEREGQQTGEREGQQTEGKGQETEGKGEEETQQKFSIEFINNYNLKELIDSYNNANNKFFNNKEQEGQEALQEQEAQKPPV